jgi:hypothetical protein
MPIASALVSEDRASSTFAQLLRIEQSARNRGMIVSTVRRTDVNCLDAENAGGVGSTMASRARRSETCDARRGVRTVPGAGRGNGPHERAVPLDAAGSRTPRGGGSHGRSRPPRRRPPWRSGWRSASHRCTLYFRAGSNVGEAGAQPENAPPSDYGCERPAAPPQRRQHQGCRTCVRSAEASSASRGTAICKRRPREQAPASVQRDALGASRRAAPAAETAVNDCNDKDATAGQLQARDAFASSPCGPMWPRSFRRCRNQISGG